MRRIRGEHGTVGGGATRSRAASFAIGFALCVLAGTPALGDRIVLENDRVIHAVVLEVTDTHVVFRDGRVTTRLARDRVVRIERGSPADAHLVDARAAFEEARVTDAILLMARAAREGADRDGLARLMIEKSEALAKALPGAAPEIREAFDRTWSEVEAVRPAGREREMLLAGIDWALARHDPATLERLLDELLADAPAFERSREALTVSMGAGFDRALDARDFPFALDVVSLLRRVDPVGASDRRVELVVLWAREERDRKEFRRALEIYATELAPLSPAIARDRAGATLEDAENHYREADRLEPVIELYEEYGLLLDPDHSRLRLTELWQELGHELLRRGENRRARLAFERAQLHAPGSADAALRRLEYEEARMALAHDDYAGHFRLGEWCAEWGMIDEAVLAFEFAARSEILGTVARERIRHVRNLRLESDLRTLVDLYEKKEYVRVVQEIEAYRSQFLPEGFRKQADELDALARDALRISVAERPQQAEVLMQLAERSFWAGDHQAAYNLIKELTERYQGTPAAARAEKFFRSIRHRLDLDRLERDRRAGPALRLSDEIESTTLPEALGPGEAELGEEVRRLRANLDRLHESPEGEGGTGVAASEQDAGRTAARTPPVRADAAASASAP